MQSMKSPVKYSGMAVLMSSVTSLVCRPHAQKPRITAVGPSSHERWYQPSLSKHRMNVSRYSASGTSHRKGMDAMFCVM